MESIAQKSIGLIKGPVVAVSGGSTYKELFHYWSREERLKSIDFYPVDERQVPIEDHQSNWGVALGALFGPLGIGSQSSHFAQTGIKYKQMLNQRFPGGIFFDQVFLGMGDDGHTASLFPGGPELDDEVSQVLETVSPKPPFPRITLGLRALWAADTLIAIATGAAKRPMVKRLLEGDTSLPITRALSGHPNPILILDEAAAGH